MPNQLCYVKKLAEDTHELWFSSIDPELVWGDDWDDAPYEHNAGEPNDVGLDQRPVQFERVILRSYPLTSACDNYLNSPFSVKALNAMEFPWLISRKCEFYSGISLEELLEELQQTNQDYELFILKENT